MTRTIFITLRALIVVATALTFRWLFLSNPTVIVGISEIHCHPVGWSYLGSTYSVDGFFDIDDSDTMERLILRKKCAIGSLKRATLCGTIADSI